MTNISIQLYADPERGGNPLPETLVAEVLDCGDKRIYVLSKTQIYIFDHGVNLRPGCTITDSSGTYRVESIFYYNKKCSFPLIIASKKQKFETNEFVERSIYYTRNDHVGTYYGLRSGIAKVLQFGPLAVFMFNVTKSELTVSRFHLGENTTIMDETGHYTFVDMIHTSKPKYPLLLMKNTDC